LQVFIVLSVSSDIVNLSKVKCMIGAMKNLLDAQKATGSAHVVVSGPSKTGHQQDDSVARLALEMHAKRVAYKEKQAAKAAAGDGAAAQK